MFENRSADRPPEAADLPRGRLTTPAQALVTQVRPSFDVVRLRVTGRSTVLNSLLQLAEASCVHRELKLRPPSCRYTLQCYHPSGLHFLVRYSQWHLTHGAEAYVDLCLHDTSASELLGWAELLHSWGLSYTVSYVEFAVDLLVRNRTHQLALRDYLRQTSLLKRATEAFDFKNTSYANSRKRTKQWKVYNRPTRRRNWWDRLLPRRREALRVRLELGARRAKLKLLGLTTLGDLAFFQFSDLLEQVLFVDVDWPKYLGAFERSFWRHATSAPRVPAILEAVLDCVGEERRTSLTGAALFLRDYLQGQYPRLGPPPSKADAPRSFTAFSDFHYWLKDSLARQDSRRLTKLSTEGAPVLPLPGPEARPGACQTRDDKPEAGSRQSNCQEPADFRAKDEPKVPQAKERPPDATHDETKQQCDVPSATRQRPPPHPP